MIIDNKHYINPINGHLLVLDGIYVTICWTSDDCDGQVDLKLHLSVRQVILFPYFDHCTLSVGDLLDSTQDKTQRHNIDQVLIE